MHKLGDFTTSAQALGHNTRLNRAAALWTTYLKLSRQAPVFSAKMLTTWKARSAARDSTWKAGSAALDCVYQGRGTLKRVTAQGALEIREVTAVRSKEQSAWRRVIMPHRTPLYAMAHGAVRTRCHLVDGKTRNSSMVPDWHARCMTQVSSSQ
jgi:hypothetical protein